MEQCCLERREVCTKFSIPSQFSQEYAWMIDVATVRKIAIYDDVSSSGTYSNVGIKADIDRFDSSAKCIHTRSTDHLV
jgi:hypothetical protein